jgi:hypothetical protein
VRLARRKMTLDTQIRIKEALQTIAEEIRGEVVIIIKNGEVVVDPLVEVRR